MVGAECRKEQQSHPDPAKLSHRLIMGWCCPTAASCLCSHVSSGIPLLVPDNVNGASALIYQVFTAPLFMTRFQANDTAGKNGNWSSSTG